MKDEHYALALAALEQLNKSFEGPITVKELVEGRMLDINVHRTRNSCACMAIVTEDYTHFNPNQACHAGLDNRYYKGFPMKAGSRIAVVSSIQKLEVDENVARDFIDYLVNRSCYMDAFASKDVDFILANGFICNTDVPANLLAAGLIASRRMWEYAYVCRGWFSMKEAGVHEDVAFGLAHSLKFNNGEVSHYETSGHCSVNGGALNMATLKNMMERNIKRKRTNYIDDTEYIGVHDLYFEGGDSLSVDLKRLIVEASRVVKPAPVAVAKSLNPFAIPVRERVGDNNITKAKAPAFLESLMAYLPKEMKK